MNNLVISNSLGIIITVVVIVAIIAVIIPTCDSGCK